MVKSTTALLLLAVMAVTVQVAYTFQCYQCSDCGELKDADKKDCNIQGVTDNKYKCVTAITADYKLTRGCVKAETTLCDTDAPECAICVTENCNTVAPKTKECYSCTDCSSVETDKNVAICKTLNIDLSCAMITKDDKTARGCTPANGPTCEALEKVDDKIKNCHICTDAKCNKKDGANAIQTGTFLMILCLAIGKMFYN